MRARTLSPGNLGGVAHRPRRPRIVSCGDCGGELDGTGTCPNDCLAPLTEGELAALQGVAPIDMDWYTVSYNYWAAGGRLMRTRTKVQALTPQGAINRVLGHAYGAHTKPHAQLVA